MVIRTASRILNSYPLFDAFGWTSDICQEPQNNNYVSYSYERRSETLNGGQLFVWILHSYMANPRDSIQIHRPKDQHYRSEKIVYQLSVTKYFKLTGFLTDSRAMPKETAWKQLWHKLGIFQARSWEIPNTAVLAERRNCAGSCPLEWDKLSSSGDTVAVQPHPKLAGCPLKILLVSKSMWPRCGFGGHCIVMREEL